MAALALLALYTSAGGAGASESTSAWAAGTLRPINLAPPVLSGTAQLGRRLSASRGSWSHRPSSYAYRWRRCDATTCVAIAGATSRTYLLTARELGKRVRVAVVASNASGRSAPALSTPSAVVTATTGEPPVNLIAPQISGVAQSAQQLSASRGSWSNRPTAFAYQWLRCNPRGESCARITGAHASTYTLAEIDVGASLRVSVIAFNAAGESAPARSAATEVVTGSSGTRHLEYVLNDGATSVYDIDNGFKLLESFALPGTSRGVRGVSVYPPTHMMFVSYGGDGGANGNGSVLAYDMVAKAVVWAKNLSSGIDSGQVSADGRLLYMPTGEVSSGGVWNVLDTANGNVVAKLETPATGPHNTVLTADGKLLLLGGRSYNHLPVYNTQTGKFQTQVGPLVGTVRPLTVNGADSISFTTATEFDGFQVGCITCPGAPVLFTVSLGLIPPGFPFTTASHGISLTPDNKELAVLDAVHKTVQFWNVAAVSKGLPPQPIVQVPVAGLEGSESGCAYDCGRDGWVQHSLDGRYVFVGDSGDVIASASRKVVAHIANLENTRKSIEVDWQGGVPIATSGRTGVGRLP